MRNNDCLHCQLNDTLDMYSEHKHRTTGNRVNVDDNIAALLECAAELIAMYDDAKTRKYVVKRSQNLLASMVRKFRAEGRYPGGPGQSAANLNMPTGH
jgi:hypothetical protein